MGMILDSEHIAIRNAIKAMPRLSIDDYGEKYNKRFEQTYNCRIISNQRVEFLSEEEMIWFILKWS